MAENKTPAAPQAGHPAGQQAQGSDSAIERDEISPEEERATAPWVQATDEGGTVRAKREMPEPDSLGG
jgi:hypothetical protein